MKENPGLRIEVSKDKFKSLPNEERDWILYQAIRHMDEHGSTWARRFYRKLIPLAAGGGMVGGLIGYFVQVAGKLF